MLIAVVIIAIATLVFTRSWTKRSGELSRQEEQIGKENYKYCDDRCYRCKEKCNERVKK
jgi:hypothetical protein